VIRLLAIAAILLLPRPAVGSEFGSQCLLLQNRPTTEQCNFRFVVASKSPRYDENFALSINDPIEYFHYTARYAPWQKMNGKSRKKGSFARPLADASAMRDLSAQDDAGTHGLYLRLPILGHIRDQFIDKDPFNDTLLFTVTAGGAGYFLNLGPLKAGVDTGVVYLKQRFANNYLHSTESLDPETNRIYDFAQFGSLSKASLCLALPHHIKLTGHADFIALKKNGQQFNYQEHGAMLQWSAVRLDGMNFGLSAQYFKRVSGLRNDHKSEGFETARSGIYLEFK
jgi:hypothetical protein